MKQFLIPASLLILVAASVAGYVFMISKIDGAVQAIATANEQVQSLTARETFARSAGTFLSDTAAARAEIATFVANDAAVAGIIQSLEDEGKRGKVAVSVGSVTVVPDGWKQHELLRVELSAHGQFAALGNFATVLESLPFASRLETASFEVSDKSWFSSFVLVFPKGKTP